ncbi:MULTISPECIES: diaminopimelate epimerase [unclassified Planococcus (in: firmicutes)]|uniref:diaminopimelate epimerase n=1 Tax=unclassified Planococcus (in: firmicutes) TaxID=2662419 RepID=UPI000C7E4869|nr:MULTISPECIES: diaminopimelate epimerase [unclassified Planococcus (in: firmicutes)]PKG47927.1 diaminopimelate epimerase [Planococcus sp. Urea-trap-24]PKG91775.1 diaminopimelate epimerase [Planococcus sp. Urea-3u-39]PKH43321.1 diaminopimelate epimerase [Planococcus sp. MB-3u-09]
MELLKVHGSMNTFFLYEGSDREDFPQLTKRLAALDPEIDGLLTVSPSTHADAKMRVFNTDGSEASMCGNGLRCVARYVCEREGIEQAVIETMKADLAVQKEQEVDAGVNMYGVEISPVSFQLADLPMMFDQHTEWRQRALPFVGADIPFTAVAVPNPHLIGIVGKDLQQDPSHQEKWAAYFNGDNPYFPDGVNLSYVTPLKEEIFVRTYERGVGFTDACGTAMTASALVSCLAGLVPFGDVSVFNPGGMVNCSVKSADGQYQLKLSGNATYLGVYRFRAGTASAGGELELMNQSDEQPAYERFIEKISGATAELR